MKIRNSPWGGVQRCEKIAEGIYSVSTAGHGGLYLSPERWARVAAMFPTQQRYAPDGWLEEDCDWALAVLAWPDLFDDRKAYWAVLTFSNASKPDDYGFPTYTWLQTAAADVVKAKAARWNAEKEKAHVAEEHRRYDAKMRGIDLDVQQPVLSL